MNLVGATVLVTGAAHGIGAALARRLAAGGAKTVIVADLDIEAAAKTAKTFGGIPIACDVTDQTAVADMVAHITETHGPIDLLCSNAGILERDPDPLDVTSASDESWNRAWHVNVMGHVHLARATLPGMIARGGGTIVNTVSAAGFLAELASASYTATKHAALAFTEALAIAHRDQGITVHALCPQGVATRMTAGATGNEPALLDGILTPEQVADAVFAGLALKEFLILPHPNVATYIRAKAENEDRWLGGMRKLRRAMRTPQTTEGHPK